MNNLNQKKTNRSTLFRIDKYVKASFEVPGSRD